MRGVGDDKDITSSYGQINFNDTTKILQTHTWTARSHGRARMGERAYRQVCGQRGRNVTVALAISPTNGIVFHPAFLGGMNGQRFNDFLSQASLNLDPNEHVIFHHG